MLANGIGPDDLAKTAGVSARYILRLVRLAFLSPMIVKTIVEGRQPQWLNSQVLLNTITIPLTWTDQAVTFTAASHV